MPRSFRVVRFACVVAFSHIAVCMAGATRIGARVANAVHVSRSSAMPWAILAITLAVAGAMIIKSATSESEICSMEKGLVRSNILVDTGSPVIARKLAGPTSFVALFVMTVCTETPACVSLLARSTAL